MFKKYFFVILILLFGFFVNYFQNNRPMAGPGITAKATPAVVSADNPATQSAVLGAQTKTFDCVAKNGLPDQACTPGAVFTDTVRGQICVSGYSSSVRDVSQSLKNEVYAEYGIYHHATGEYEVDHLISLELGGSNDISNL